MAVPSISIVIPVLNEAAGLPGCLTALEPLRGAGCELVVVDGGSSDDTAALARGMADRVLVAPRGRATQMNAGAAVAAGEVLWFLHGDTRPPAGAPALIREVLREHRWGRFDVRLSGSAPLLRVVETMMNVRSRWSGIATGDQGIFVERAAFQAVGGYPEIPLMEDVALSAALKRLGRPACLHQRLTTSSRRWERDGILRTVVLMWRLRLAYALGADPAHLARAYYGS